MPCCGFRWATNTSSRATPPVPPNTCGARSNIWKIAGAMATMTGVFFLAALIFAPERGLIAKRLERVRRRQRFAVEMLLVHLSRHEHESGEEHESEMAHLTGELNWAAGFAQATVERASHLGWIERQDGYLQLTDSGRTVAEQVLAR